MRLEGERESENSRIGAARRGWQRPWRTPLGVAGGGIGTVALVLVALFFGWIPR